MLRLQHAGILVGVGVLGALAIAPASAQTVISYFNFNNLSGNDPGFSPLSATSGSGTLTTDFAGVGDVRNFSGTTVNAVGADLDGKALTLQGGKDLPNNGRHLTLQLSTTDLYSIKLSYATQRTDTGFNSNRLSYSTDGTNFTSFGAAYNPATSFALQSFDLSSISALNNQSNIYLRLTFSGATQQNGNNRIDNLKVTAGLVPGPSSLAVFALGGLAPVMAILRRRRAAK